MYVISFMCLNIKLPLFRMYDTLFTLKRTTRQFQAVTLISSYLEKEETIGFCFFWREHLQLDARTGWVATLKSIQ